MFSQIKLITAANFGLCIYDITPIPIFEIFIYFNPVTFVYQRHMIYLYDLSHHGCLAKCICRGQEWLFPIHAIFVKFSHIIY